MKMTFGTQYVNMKKDVKLLPFRCKKLIAVCQQYDTKCNQEVSKMSSKS